MLKVEDQEYLDEVKKFAESIGKLDDLNSKLESLSNRQYCDHEVKCLLFKDFAPYSFVFIIQIETAENLWESVMNGGLIFHGQYDNGGDGGAPTFSVNLEPVSGWSIHT